MAWREDWIERLCENEIVELESAVGRLEASGLEQAQITPEDAPLPILASRLNALLDEVLNGRGFVLLI